MDRHLLAAISIAGTSLDLLGGMYLAYDLLGGRHGPLRTLTRAVTYAAIFGLAFGLPLGWRFGLAVGLTHGFTLAIEYSRAAREQSDSGLLLDAVFSLIRAVGYGIGLYYYKSLGMRFAILFTVLSTVGQVFAYSRGISPATDYEAIARPRLSRRQLFGVVNRTVGYTIAALLCGIAAKGSYSLALALKIGLVMGVATAFAVFINPYVEWTAENLPERRLGVFGICLILAGFSLQSVQYWITLLDIPVK
jgi:hypothetical protein